MLVDKTLFLDYTRRQDDILNNIQEAVTWLGLGDVPLSPPLADSLVACVDEAARTVEMLRPSLMAAIDLILHGRRARSDVKSHIHDIRQQHLKVFKAKRRLIAAAYASGLEFRQIYQLMKAEDRICSLRNRKLTRPGVAVRTIQESSTIKK